MENFDKTMKFDYEEIPKENFRSVLSNVHRTLEERGYNAVNQIVGYLLSGDPAYIPRQNEARNQIRHVDRDVIMEELVSYYLKEKNNYYMLQHKILGLDVGSKTVGIAISDLMGWTAQGLDTLRINEEQEEYGIEQLTNIIKSNNVDTIVIGLPKNMNNSIGFRGEASIHYKELILEAMPDMKVIMWDERLSTMAAERSLLEADVSRQKRKKVIDKMAAVFILQGYLDSIQ